MVTKRYLFAAFACIVFFMQPVAAQLPLKAQPIYVHYNSFNSSLPTEMVYKVVSDNNGYIWLATDKGLVKFNGKEFKIINTGSFEDVVSIYKTKENILWVFTYTGRTRAVDLNSHRLINTDSLYGLDKLKKKSDAPYLTGLQKDNLLFLQKQGSRNAICVDLTTRKSYIGDSLGKTIMLQYQLPAYSGKIVTKVLLDSFANKNPGLYVKDSLLILDNKIFFLSNNRPSYLLFNGDDFNIHQSIQSGVRYNNDLLIGGLKDLGLVKIKNYFSSPGNNVTVETLLHSEQVTNIEVDYLQNVWVSTHDNGLFFFPGSEINSLYYNKANSGLHDDNISMFRKSGNNTIVIGYGNPTVDFFTATAFRRHSIPIKEHFSSIRCVEKLSNRWLLFTRAEVFSGSENKRGTLLRFSTLSPTNTNIGYKNGSKLRDTFYYATGSNIMTVDEKGALKKHPLSFITKNKKLCLLPLDDGDFCIGTVRGAFYNTHFLPYLQNEQINSISTSRNLIVFCTNTGTYAIHRTNILNKNDLSKISATAAYEMKDDSDYLYIKNSNNELEIFKRRNFELVNVFSAKKYYIPFAISDFWIDSNHVVLSGNRGIFYLQKEQLLNMSNTVSPAVHILSSLNNYSPNDSAYTCNFHKNFSALFGIDVLDYGHSNKQITYKILKDGKEIYSRTGVEENAQVNFQPTGPGEYRILFLVDFRPAVPPKIVSYTILIKPLWYQQFWFYPLLIIAAILLIFYASYKVYTYKTIQRHKKLAQELYMQELEAKSFFGQLKPHFIFNLLTPLQGFFLKGQKMEGLNYLNSFSSLIRDILNSMRDKHTTLKKELDFATNYLAVQQDRYGYSFCYTISIGEDIVPELYVIPTLLIQPLLENAIEHGLKKTKAAGKIIIAITKAERALVITIKDNGTGLPEDFSYKKNHALQIISERLQLLKKTDGIGDLTIMTNLSGPGTSAILTLPRNLKT